MRKSTWLLIGLLCVPFIVKGATSYEVHNLPDMHLDASITSTQTAGIKVSPPRYGLTIIWPALSGGVLKLEQGSQYEHIYYSSATINSSTFVSTLSGVIRGLCHTDNDDFEACDDASEQQSFGKGAKVSHVVAAQLLNLKANKDRANLFTASGSVNFSGSGSFRPPVFANTTERNQQLPTPFPFTVVGNTASGTLQVLIGGQWVSLATGTGSLQNATESVSGKVQLASTGAVILRTDTGASGAAAVLQAKNTTATGGTAHYKGYVPQLNQDGVLEPTMLGTGTPSSTTALLGDGTWTAALVPTGAVFPWVTNTAPSGYLLSYGQAVSRTTYSALAAVVAPNLGTFTVTAANPAVFTLSNHGLEVNDAVWFTTTGELLGGIDDNTPYYVISAGLTASEFQVSSTVGGSAVNTGGDTQSGVHNAYKANFGIGDGTELSAPTTFNLPDLRGRFPLGQDDMGGTGANRVTHVNADGIGLADAGVKQHASGTGSVKYQTLNYIIKF